MPLRKRERHELESYDEYARVVVHLDEKTRVIGCRDGVQWIIQRCCGQRWDSISFCRTKEALLRCAGKKAILDALPDRFQEAAKADTAEMTEPAEAE